MPSLDRSKTIVVRHLAAESDTRDVVAHAPLDSNHDLEQLNTSLGYSSTLVPAVGRSSRLDPTAAEESDDLNSTTRHVAREAAAARQLPVVRVHWETATMMSWTSVKARLNSKRQFRVMAAVANSSSGSEDYLKAAAAPRPHRDGTAAVPMAARMEEDSLPPHCESLHRGIRLPRRHWPRR
jgi:hypothetical protein